MGTRIVYNLNDVLKKVTIMKHNYMVARQILLKEKEAFKKGKQRVIHTQEAQTIIQEVAAKIQQEAHQRISTIVSRCLSAVFKKPYQFNIVFEKKRGKTEARLVFERNGEEYDPVDGAGGGALDVAALGLRLACLSLQIPKRRRVLICDEPLKNINGQGNRERAAALITALSKDFGVQLIITTGYDWLEIGNVIRL